MMHMNLKIWAYALDGKVVGRCIKGSYYTCHPFKIPSHPSSSHSNPSQIPNLISIPIPNSIPNPIQIPSQIPFKFHLYPVVIEGQKYHHSNQLIEMSRMVIFPFF